MKNKPPRFLRDIRTHSHPHTAAGQCKTLYFMFQCVWQLMWLCPSCGRTPSSWPDTRRDFHVRRGASSCSNKRWLHPYCWLARLCVCVRVCVRLWVHVCALWEVKMFALVLFPITALFNAVFSLFFFFTLRLWQFALPRPSLSFAPEQHTFVLPHSITSLTLQENQGSLKWRPTAELHTQKKLTGIDWPVLWWSSWPFSLDYNWWREEWNAHMHMLHLRALCLIYCPCVPLI